MMRQGWLITAIACAWCAGCGSVATGADEPGVVSESSIHAQATVVSEELTAPPAGEPVASIDRTELRALLKRGPAYLLARLELVPVYEKRRFVGFRIERFKTQPPSYLELKTGDVVRRVNGRIIDTPESYFEIFEELKVASELRFALVRAGQPMTLSYPIVDSAP